MRIQEKNIQDINPIPEESPEDIQKLCSDMRELVKQEKEKEKANYESVMEMLHKRDELETITYALKSLLYTSGCLWHKGKNILIIKPPTDELDKYGIYIADTEDQKGVVISLKIIDASMLQKKSDLQEKLTDLDDKIAALNATKDEPIQEPRNRAERRALKYK